MMIKIVGRTLCLLWTIFALMCFIAMVIVASIWLAMSGELEYIALISVNVIVIAVLMRGAVSNAKTICKNCTAIDKILGGGQNAEDKN